MTTSTELKDEGVRAFSDTSYTIGDFCTAERLSLSKFYSLKRKGLGPKEMNVDGAIRISSEARRAWRAARENPTGEEQVETERRIRERIDHCRRAGKLAAESPRHVSKKKQRKRPAPGAGK